MLVFPPWRSEFTGAGCRLQRWVPVDRFAPYLARPVALPPLPPQTEDEDSLSGGSSPERTESGSEGLEATWCEWRGCGARFSSVARLSAHVSRTHAHAHADGLFYCGWKGCARPQRGFNARYKMLVHVRTHTNERPHTCNQCSKSFSRAENLKIHLRSHSGEKPYVCPYEGCGKAYSNSSDRFKHTRTHTVDKPYCCKVPGCNKRYTDPSSLRKHVKTYKHFITEETKISEETKIQEIQPINENRIPNYEPMDTLQSRLSYSPPTSTTSPLIPPYSPILPEHPLRYPLDQVSYMRPLEPMYPIRVPSHEMSYLEYTQMYEHTYRNYYTNNMSYPVFRPTVIEKAYSYQDKPTLNDATMEVEVEKETIYHTNEMPLNLCSKRLECKPIEELVRRTDMPLDLSTKSLIFLQ